MAPNPARPGPVHRLSFQYAGDRIRLVSDQLVTMIAPPSHPLDEPEVPAGFSMVVRDSRGQALYRFTGVSPMGHDREVFSDDPARTLHRTPVEEPSGTFVMLAPHIEGAVAVELFGHPLVRGRMARTPRRLARFVLKSPEAGR